jgi:ribosomal protein S18 acetylase RimI-like enzyme
MIIEPVQASEKAALLALAVDTGLFSAEDAEGLLGTIVDSFSNNELPSQHAVVVCRDFQGGPVVGWSYFAPDHYAEDVWNVWWIGVAPKRHGTGPGRALLSFVEKAVAEARGRVIVIETSDQDFLSCARKFYTKAGYNERGRIPDFYSKDESKVIFSRSFKDTV